MCPCEGDEGPAAVMAIAVALGLWLVLRVARGDAGRPGKTRDREKDRDMNGEDGKESCGTGIYWKTAVVVALAIAVGVVLWMKKDRAAGRRTAAAERPATPAAAEAKAGVESKTDAPGPRPEIPEPQPKAAALKPVLLELGSTTCIPCKMMARVLDQLNRDYSDRLSIEFIDVTVNRAAAERWRIRVIPTQVFLSPDGKELFRHEGFYPKEDIVRKWKELGYDLDAAASSSAAPTAGRS